MAVSSALARGAVAGSGRQEAPTTAPPSLGHGWRAWRCPQAAVGGFRTFHAVGTFDRMIRGRSASLGVVVCVLAALAGCDGDAASQPTSSATTSGGSGA